jgi:hypothetical protein
VTENFSVRENFTGESRDERTIQRAAHAQLIPAQAELSSGPRQRQVIYEADFRSFEPRRMPDATYFYLRWRIENGSRLAAAIAPR